MNDELMGEALNKRRGKGLDLTVLLDGKPIILNGEPVAQAEGLGEAVEGALPGGQEDGMERERQAGEGEAAPDAMKDLASVQGAMEGGGAMGGGLRAKAMKTNGDRLAQMNEKK